MFRKIIALIIMFSYVPTHTTVVIRGNDDKKPFGFKTIVTTKVLDTKAGAFYVGITNSTKDNKNSGTFAVSKANRPTSRSTQSFTGIAQDNLVDKTIEFLDLLPQDQAPPLLAVIPQNGAGKETTKITILPTDGNKPVEHDAALRDAQGNENSSTTGIVNIATTSSHVFAAVRPRVGANNNFGDPNGGIALVAVKRKVDGLVEVTAKDATTGEDGNRALELQANSAEITGNTNPVIFAGGDDANQVAMHFDEQLNLVYIGLRIATGGNAGDKGKAVVIARLNPPNNEVVLQTITADGAITNNQQIIVAQGADINLRAKLIRVLHASTGPSYLIVNGGTGTTNEVSNKIFALPLVDSSASPSHGTLANKNSELFNGKFILPAALVNELPTQGDIAAKVGGGDLPIQDQTEVTDMVVVGDTVYASIGIKPDDNNDTGIFYSQALFDANGKIIRWTPWTKRAVPLNAFVGTNLPDDNNEDGIPHDGSIKLFNVDAATGNVWVVENTTGRVVGITSWTDKSTAGRLITKLNEVLEDGCFSVLDIDQSTQGFSGVQSTAHRYALFGGANIVVFARISQAQGMAIINNPQTVITDFSDPQNLRVSNLPTDAGCAQALEYGKRNPGLPNFFFAGTQNGLFVFSNPNGTGFNVTTLTTLDMPPFSNGVWQKISNITGSVIDIKTSGESLYVLTTETTNTQPFKSTLYNIPFQGNVTAMFANTNITTIAETGEGIFTNVTAFFGMQIISTGNENMPTEVREQLVLATSNGLYKSNALQTKPNGLNRGIADATNQTNAMWQLIANSQNTLFVGIGGVETPVRHTVWPFSIQDADRLKTFDRGSIHQISGSEDPTLLNQATRADQPLIGTFNPLQFNAQNDENFTTLDPITHFWSDGGRRFFIFNRIIDPTTQNKLGVIPFDVGTFGITTPTILTHPILKKIQRFYWVQAIGASGLVLAGTEQGVVGLE